MESEHMNSNETALAVLQQYWDRLLPVDPVKMATTAGIAVYRRGEAGDEGFVNSGAYRKIKGTPIIEFNATESAVRQRYVVAHAFGHWALGHEDVPVEVGNVFDNDDPREVAANNFATAILMPTAIVIDIYRSGRTADLADMASKFGVSKDAMGYRLINLGLMNIRPHRSRPG